MMIFARTFTAVRDSTTTASSRHNTNLDWEIYFYIAAQLVGGIGLTVLLITMFWPFKKRK